MVKLTKVESVYGRVYYVSLADRYSDKQQLPLYTKTGKLYSELPPGHILRIGGTTIHRENIQWWATMWYHDKEDEPAKSSFGGQIRIVLRNPKTDRLYILEVNAHHEEQGWWYSVTSFWGAWTTYERSGFAELRHWNRYSGRDRAAMQQTVRDIMQEKLTRFDYRVVEERSILPDWPILHYGQNWRVYKYHEEESHGDNLSVRDADSTGTGSARRGATVRQLQMW